ncbi:MAG TPA: helix-turn-helix transcriptional regulator [Candidatus Angelobacter sp.]|nr:helix-turn-helix transcriptional regulator [Candidatus Angelobacter sp.]
MPIKVNLDRIMFEKKVSLTDLAGRIGITLANLSILKTDKARAVRFSTLAALCRELQCQPGDLLEYMAEPNQPTPDSKGNGDRET